MIDDKLLLSVSKPIQYTGGELGMVKKDINAVDMRFAFCFPDNYEVGMSHLGMRILYHLLNERADTYCERVFAPWPDMEEKMRARGEVLFSIETKSPVRDFDIIGFTLMYEMSYSNVVNMLDLSGVPVLASARGEGDPFVCAGGACAYNGEPLADFIDFFVLGEGEEVLNEVMDVYADWKKQKQSRITFLERIAALEGIYVPSFYNVDYNADGTIKSFTKNNAHAKDTIRKRIIKDFDNSYFPEQIIVPFGETVHDRITLEIFRGCIRGCRFCQAGYVYRPVREKSAKKLVELANKLMTSTGYEEISLCSLSTSDYRELNALTEGLLSEIEKQKVNLSLPSLRIDNFSLDLMHKVQTVRKSGITFAPEAGTQRLRDVIKKGVTEEDLIRSVSMVFSGGWTNLKLYFMIGLPTETVDDVRGIGNLAHKVLDAYYAQPKEERQGSARISVSASTFVPKPFTPFQWEAQDDLDTILEKQKAVRSSIRSRQISFSWHESKVTILEGVFARGDRRLGKVLLAAQKLGCKFDGWDEYFNFEAWMQAFDECGIDIKFYNNRKRSFDEILPWDHIDVGVTKAFLQKECELAYRGIVTPNCREKCTGCGASCFGGGVCFER